MASINRAIELVKTLRAYELNKPIPRDNELCTELEAALIDINSRYATAMSNKDKYHLMPTKVTVTNRGGSKSQVRMLCLVHKNNQSNIIPISVTKISPGKAKFNKGKVVAKVFRDTVRYQAEEFRKKWNRRVAEAKKKKNFAEVKALKTCPLSGRHLDSGETHIDHVIPFADILKEFLIIEGIEKKEDVELKGRGNNRELKDQNLAERWKEFHRKNAQFQVVLGIENKRKGKKDMDLYLKERSNHEQSPQD